MDNYEIMENSAKYLKIDRSAALKQLEMTGRLFSEVKNSIKRIEKGLLLNPGEWEGLSAEAHRQFCAEVFEEINLIIDELDDMSEKLDYVVNKHKTDNNAADTSLPSSVL